MGEPRDDFPMFAKNVYRCDGVPEATIRERRIEDKLVPAFKRIDTCAEIGRAHV